MTAEGEGRGTDDSGEILLVELDELLYRQVHPGFVDDGIPSAQAFAPTKKDEGKLSIARGKLTTAEGAYTHHTSALHLKSAGSWGLTVAETNGASYRPLASRSPEALPMDSSIFAISDAVRPRRRPSSCSRTQRRVVGSIRRRYWPEATQQLSSERARRLTIRGSENSVPLR